MSFCLSLICFCFYCVCFYLFLFCVLLCCDLPAGKKLFKNVDIFRSFSPSASLSLSLSLHQPQTNCARCAPTLLSLSLFFVSFCYTTLHRHSLTLTHSITSRLVLLSCLLLLVFLFLLLNRLFSFCFFVFSFLVRVSF